MIFVARGGALSVIFVAPVVGALGVIFIGPDVSAPGVSREEIPGAILVALAVDGLGVLDLASCDGPSSSRGRLLDPGSVGGACDGGTVGGSGARGVTRTGAGLAVGVI